MPSKIAVTNLQGNTLDVLNVIRANASPQYQSLIPEVEKFEDVRQVGRIFEGYPNFANEFLSALVNRIAAVRARSAIFNNPYSALKKGMLTFGEVIEEVFVGIAKAREFNVEKAEAREFKRTIPDVRTAFHVLNYKVQYPATIERNELFQAFTSIDGVTDLIARIVDGIYTAANYDEYLLFKYLLIKAITKGKTYPVPVNMTDIKNTAVAFRGMSNKLTFMSSKYNTEGVMTVTPKSDQYIFMDADFNAKYDVEVLASAFNMDKADFMGRLILIDDWTTFDNARFDIVRQNSTQIEEVTAGELALMADVKAVLVDSEWFQVYDNLNEFSEKFIASGLYWNYFYNVWKTVSFSPFSNMITFVDSSATTNALETLTFKISSIDASDICTVINLEYSGSASLQSTQYHFVQTEDDTEAGIACHKYGAYIIPSTSEATTITPTLVLGDTTYVADAVTIASAAVGDTLTFEIPD